MTRRNISTSERVAIFYRTGGICHICGEKIGLAERWDIEHVIPLAMGGDEAKGSDNLQPSHASCHRSKTSVDAWQIAKAKRVRARHMGVKGRKQLIPGSRGTKFRKRLDGTVERRS